MDGRMKRKGATNMRRLCALQIRGKNRKSLKELSALLDAWKLTGAEVCVVTRDANIGWRMDVPTVPTLSQALGQAQETGCGELVVMSDEWMGPVHPLDELCRRAEQCVQPVWQLVRGGPMWGIRPQLWKAVEAARDDGLEAVWEAQGIVPEELYDTRDLTEVTAVPMLDEPLLMVRDRKCPFFLSEVFFRDYSDVITTTLGHQAQVFYRWLQQESGWDTDLLWDYLLKNCHQQDYVQNMHLLYVLPTRGSDRAWTARHLEEHPLALVMHLYYPDKLQESCSFAQRFPEQTHLIITTSDEQKREKILSVFAGKKFASLDVRVIANRGRDVSALLVGAAEVFDQYEYVCFFHDKKTLQTKPGSIGAGFAYRLQENLFGTRDYVNNIIRLFYENPRLGILSPPPPHHGDYFFTLGLDWGANYTQTKLLSDRLGFQAPIAPDKMPIAPLGTCFWFRGRALKPLADHHWNYSEFPPEPNNPDGTLLHAIERIYSYASVEAGLYPAFLLSDRYAGTEYSSMRHYVREFNKLCINHGMMGYQRDLCRGLEARLQGK